MSERKSFKWNQLKEVCIYCGDMYIPKDSNANEKYLYCSSICERDDFHEEVSK